MNKTTCNYKLFYSCKEKTFLPRSYPLQISFSIDRNKCVPFDSQALNFTPNLFFYFDECNKPLKRALFESIYREKDLYGDDRSRSQFLPSLLQGT